MSFNQLHQTPTKQLGKRPPVIRPKMALLAGFASVATVSLLIVIKFAAYWMSGSTAVLASLIDSAMDASVSVMMLMAIHWSLKPADKDHRHGHGKIEGLAALGQAVFIGIAGVYLVIEALQRFAGGTVIQHHMVVIIVMAISAALSFALVAIQRRALRFAPSLAVEADKAHFSMDIYINLGVILVIAAIYLGAPVWIDPAFAILMAFYLGYTMKDVGRKGLDMLLDKELGGEAREAITRIALSHPEVKGMHDLRTHKSGMKKFISFDVEMAPDLLLCQAHGVAREIEQEILRKYPNAEILIHIDPLDDTEDSRHAVEGVHH